MRTRLGFEAGDGLELTVGVADALELGFGEVCASKTPSAATAIMLPAPE
jgi:hypothetical protein